MRTWFDPTARWRWLVAACVGYGCWALLGPHLTLLWVLGGLLLAWLAQRQARWERVARQGIWNVERDQARQRLRQGTLAMALLCLLLGILTLATVW